MAKFNPFALRSQDPTESVFREFKRPDGKGGEEPFVLTFKALSEPEKGVAQDLLNKLVMRYLGDADNDIEPEAEFPPVDGAAVPVSRTLFQNAAVIYAQQPDDASERYSAEEIVAMSAVLKPRVWQSILMFSNEITEKASKNPQESGSTTP